jgi:ATP-dependent Lon protease
MTEEQKNNKRTYNNMSEDNNISEDNKNTHQNEPPKKKIKKEEKEKIIEEEIHTPKVKKNKNKKKVKKSSKTKSNEKKFNHKIEKSRKRGLYQQKSFKMMLNTKIKKLNLVYLDLTYSVNHKKDYRHFENMYRNEEMEIVYLLAQENLTPDYLNDDKFGLNHYFQILPLDKIGKKKKKPLIIIDEEEIDEDSDIEEILEEEETSDEDYSPVKESEKILEMFFGTGKPYEEPNSCDKLIKKSNLSKKKKEYLLEEYEKILEIRRNSLPDKLKILEMNIPIDVKAEIIEKIEMLDDSHHDDVKTREWIKRVLKIPFGEYSENPIKDLSDKKEVGDFLQKFHKTLNEAIYGQDKVKEALIEIITKWTTSGSKRGNCIAISGPPGVGKTSIVREGLAKALNRKFCSFSLAGVSDENYLTGFPFTYEGATCGRFAKMLMDSGCMNPIIFMDELDKVDTKRSMSVYNKLIEITDFSQNHEIEDHYFGSNIKLDLSQCIFIFSLNHLENVDPILKDRLEVIEVEGFEKKDKIKIAKHFLIPRELKEYNETLEFTEEIIKHIIMRVKDEQGVRNLKRGISKILRKINVLQYYNNKKLSYNMKKFNKKTLKITPSLIDKLLKDETKINPMILKLYS